MNHFEINWAEFLKTLDHWEPLSAEARKAFLTLSEPTGVPAVDFGRTLEELEKSGLLERLPSDPSRVKTPADLKPFRRAIRAMHRYPLFGLTDKRIRRQVLRDYIIDNFTTDERAGFTYRQHGFHVDLDALINQVTQSEWLDRFLKITTEKQLQHYENEYSAPKPRFGGRAPTKEPPQVPLTHFALPTIGKVQDFLRRVAEQPEPVPFANLKEQFADLTETQLAIALYTTVRYMLLFPALRAEDHEPVIGAWPGIIQRLRHAPAALPEALTPEKTLAVPFEVEDMTILLAACATNPPRLRTDQSIFAKAQQEILSRSVDLPDWFVQAAGYQNDRRLGVAQHRLLQMGFAAIKGKVGSDLRLEATKAGLGWLALSAKERLKAVLDRVREGSKAAEARKRSAAAYNWGEIATQLQLLPIPLQFTGHGIEPPDFEREVIQAFSVAGETFFPIGAFYRHAVEVRNPLPGLFKRGRFATLSFGRHYIAPYGGEPSPEDLETVWADVLHMFLLSRLVPLGGARLGIAGKTACFALTDIGFYLMGKQSDFEHGVAAKAGVIVQPNLEIVFLAPSPTHEVSIGRLAERIGKGVGTLFRITKRSILNAAGAGIDSDEAIRIIEQASTKTIPGNVAREIRGWFAQCRHVAMRKAFLIRCPDAETAARVRAIGGKSIDPITDTVLELNDEKQKTPLVRKLRDAGIFLKI